MRSAMRVGVCCALLSAVLSCPPAWPQAAPDGEAILAEAGRFARSLQTIVGDMRTTMTMADRTISMRSRIWAQLPDKVLNITEAPGNAMALYVIGNQQIIYFAKMNKYATSQLQAPLAPVLVQEFVSGGVSENGVFSPSLGAREVTLEGKETCDGVPAHRLSIRIPGKVTGHLWIAEGERPLPVRVLCTDAQTGMKCEVSFRWLVNQPIHESAFQFSPPPGATDMLAGLPKQ